MNVFIFENDSEMHVIVAKDEARAREMLASAHQDLGWPGCGSDEEDEEFELIADFPADIESSVNWSK